MGLVLNAHIIIESGSDHWKVEAVLMAFFAAEMLHFSDSVHSDVESQVEPSRTNSCESSSARGPRVAGSLTPGYSAMVSATQSWTLTQHNNNPFWRGCVFTGEEPPPHSGESNHALSKQVALTQSQLSRPKSSRHHISTEHHYGGNILC